MGILKVFTLLAAAAAAAAGCASTKPALIIQSSPEGAEVSTSQGEKIGTTPLSLEGSALSNLVEGGRIGLILSARGYLDRELLLDIHGFDKHTVHLTPLDDNYFSSRLIATYTKQANAMVRELLRIQGLLILSRYDEADSALVEFEKKYPNIAASYVLRANIARSQGKPDLARDFLLRARSLDDSDPVVGRMLSVDSSLSDTGGKGK